MQRFHFSLTLSHSPTLKVLTWCVQKENYASIFSLMSSFSLFSFPRIAIYEQQQQLSSYQNEGIHFTFLCDIYFPIFIMIRYVTDNTNRHCIDTLFIHLCLSYLT